MKRAHRNITVALAGFLVTAMCGPAMAGPLSSARHIQKRDVGRIVWTRDRHSSTFVAGRLVSSLPVGSDLHVSPTRTPESKT